MWSWFANNTPTDIASPCVHCFREAGSCVSVQHAYLYRMRFSRVRACVFLVYAHDTPPRVFSTLVLFITIGRTFLQHMHYALTLSTTHMYLYAYPTLHLTHRSLTQFFKGAYMYLLHHSSHAKAYLRRYITTNLKISELCHCYCSQ